MAQQVALDEIRGRGTNFLDENLEVLRSENPSLAKLIETFPDDGTDPQWEGLRFNVSLARNGMETLSACYHGDEIFIHSKYDPLREAQDKVRGGFDDKKKNLFVLLGFGLGYVVDELIEKATSNTSIIVIEPHFASFVLALKTRDLRKILSDKRVSLSFGSRIEDGLAAFLSRYNLAHCTGVGFIELNGRNKLPSANFYHDFLERLKGVIITSGGNLQTLMTMAWTYQKNTMISLGQIISSPPVRNLFGAFEGKPGIVVSAGPSLDKNIHLLKDVKDNAVIIAVDTSLRRILSEGIEPHLICTGDPQEANYRHLKGVETKDAHLVAEPMTYFASLEQFSNRLFIASYGDKVMQWISNFIPDVGHTMCWGSVATMAFDLARKMGCDPIIFIGQDLSFPGGRTYVKGTYFEDEEGQDMSVDSYEKTHRTFSVLDIYGNSIKTNRQMFAYKEWFRTEFARTKAKVINATEGGILTENCEIIPFADAIKKYVSATFDVKSVIESHAAEFDGYDLTELRKGLFETIGSIQKIIEICEDGTKLIREALKVLTGMNELPQVWCVQTIGKLDALRFKLRAEPAMSPFIETANQTGVLNFQRGYMKLNNKEFSRVVFENVLDLYSDLFMSMGRTSRGLLPFFVKGYTTINNNSEPRK